MNIRRLLSYIVVVGLAFFLWITWQKEHPEVAPVPDTSQTQAKAGEKSAFYVPPESTAAVSVPPVSKKVRSSSGAPNQLDPQRASASTVHVKTDVLDLEIDLNGGEVISSSLPKYTVSLKNSEPFTLLSSEPEKLYLAQNGLQNSAGKIEKIKFKADKTSYKLASDSNKLIVKLTGKTSTGLDVTKKYTFDRASYAVKLDYVLKNTKSREWTGRLYTQFIRKEQPSSGHMFQAHSYEGASMSSPDRPYEKISYSAMQKKALDRSHVGGWVAMQQLYFLSAWIPQNQTQLNQFYSKVDKARNLYMIGFKGPELVVPQGKSVTTGAILYTGPELPKLLVPLAPGLDRTVDYGWLWWVSKIIFWLMSLVHAILGNWGWAIVITTITIKLILYPLSATSFRSMARMRELQPKMQALKEKFADDRQAMSKATMELYRKESINPLGGCLPMLIQVPIFIGLYYVIIESVQLRQAHFLFWINDLSVKDPYYILPVLMGVSMLLQQRLSPTSPDPVQAKMMMFVPVVFTAFFLNFPAGLTLYWLVNNCVQIAQQWYVTRTYDDYKAKKNKNKKKKKNKNKTYRL